MRLVNLYFVSEFDLTEEDLIFFAHESFQVRQIFICTQLNGLNIALSHL